jgi:hypothetical protein
MWVGYVMEVDRRRNSTSTKHPIKPSKEAITSGWWRRCCTGMSAECMVLFQLEENMEVCVSKCDERKREDIYEGCVQLYRRICCPIHIWRTHKSCVLFLLLLFNMCDSKNYTWFSNYKWETMKINMWKWRRIHIVHINLLSSLSVGNIPSPKLFLPFFHRIYVVYKPAFLRRHWGQIPPGDFWHHSSYVSLIYMIHLHFNHILNGQMFLEKEL